MWLASKDPRLHGKWEHLWVAGVDIFHVVCQTSYNIHSKNLCAFLSEGLITIWTLLYFQQHQLGDDVVQNVDKRIVWIRYFKRYSFKERLSTLAAASNTKHVRITDGKMWRSPLPLRNSRSSYIDVHLLVFWIFTNLVLYSKYVPLRHIITACQDHNSDPSTTNQSDTSFPELYCRWL